MAFFAIDFGFDIGRVYYFLIAIGVLLSAVLVAYLSRDESVAVKRTLRFIANLLIASSIFFLLFFLNPILAIVVTLIWFFVIPTNDDMYKLFVVSLFAPFALFYIVASRINNLWLTVLFIVTIFVLYLHHVFYTTNELSKESMVAKREQLLLPALSFLLILSISIFFF